MCDMTIKLNKQQDSRIREALKTGILDLLVFDEFCPLLKNYIRDMITLRGIVSEAVVERGGGVDDLPKGPVQANIDVNDEGSVNTLVSALETGELTPPLRWFELAAVKNEKNVFWDYAALLVEQIGENSKLK